ncbi:MAG: hypothetical protein Q9209_003974 [Squamulea sp. 1 TL-2023]
MYRDDDYVRDRRRHSLPRKQVAHHRDSFDSYEGALISRRDYERELYHPKKEVAFNDSQHHGSQSRSRSSRSSRRRHHSRYSDSSDSSDSDNDSELWSQAQEQTSAARRKTLLYTGLATITSIGAINGLYQSTKAHQQRKKQLREGELSKNEAAELQKEHRKSDLISLGLVAVSCYNTRLGWQRMKGKHVEEQKVRDEYDKKRNIRT